MNERPLMERLLEYVQRPEYRAVKPRVIAKKLGLEPDQRRELRLAIKRLVQRGLLVYGAEHLVHAAPPADADQTERPAASSRPAGKSRPTTPPPRARHKPESHDDDGDNNDGEELDELMEPDDAAESSADDEFVAAEDDSVDDELVSSDESADDAQPPAGETEHRRKSRKKDKRRGRDERATRADETNAESARYVPRGRDAQTSRDAERSVVVGTFRRTTAGHGFVRPKSAKDRRDRSRDIYISAEHTRDAASGDVVSVRISGRAKFGERRVCGEIVEVLERDTHRFVGVYEERDGSAYVRIDGNLFAQPISVGDPGAKSAVDGDKVVIEMVRFPTHYFDGEAVVVEVLGARGTPGVDTLSIIYEFDLPQEFPEDVLEVAREQAEHFDPANLHGRRDLTGDTIITIDPVDARDFDDAISLVRTPEGHWRLSVHIADVTHFVPVRSALDREARERATSVYLPDRVIPMLPETISNHLASLQPDQVRYARTVEMEFTEEGVRVATEVYRSAICSKRRFTYEEVDEYLADPAAWTDKLTPEVHGLVGRMHDFAMVLRKRRLDAGSIELHLPEVKIDLDRAGQVVGAHVVENTVSHQIIEEFMLAANEAVATWLHDEGFLFLRRVHEQPDLRRLKAVTTFVRELGIECDSLESRFEIKRVIAAVSGQPMERAVNFAVLKSMQKAHYSPIDEGHYALHSRHYCHFTSPIRRYPDLTVHRLCDALAHGRRARQSEEELASLGEHCSEREQRAERAERELVKVKLLTLLANRIGQQFDAVITGVESFGIFAQGIELPAEGLIHVNALRDDYYDYDASTHALVGRRAGNTLRLGDPIRVEIGRVDVDRRELDLRLVRRQTRPTRDKLRSKKSGKQRGKTRGNRKRGHR